MSIAITIIFLLFAGRCIQEDCDSEDNDWRSGARSLDDPQSDALLQQPGDGALMASYSVFVVEPGEDIGKGEFSIYSNHKTFTWPI